MYVCYYYSPRHYYILLFITKQYAQLRLHEIEGILFSFPFRALLLQLFSLLVEGDGVINFGFFWCCAGDSLFDGIDRVLDYVFKNYLERRCWVLHLPLPTTLSAILSTFCAIVSPTVLVLILWLFVRLCTWFGVAFTGVLGSHGGVSSLLFSCFDSVLRGSGLKCVLCGLFSRIVLALC